MDAICFLVNDKYFNQFIVCWESIKTHNNIKNVIILNDGLNIEQKEYIKTVTNNVEFVNVDYSRYNNIKKVSEYGYLIPAYKKLEAFKIRGYDKILVMDVDMICLKSFDKVFNVDCKIAMCKHKNEHEYNSGFMLLDKSILNDNVYNELISELGIISYSADQNIINRVFNNITELNSKYNTYNTQEITDDTVNIHYIGRNKPIDNEVENSSYFNCYL